MESLAEILAAVSQMRERETVALNIGVDWCFYLQMEVADSTTQQSNYTAWHTTLP